MKSDVITKTVFFNASRETVWSFLTQKEKLAKWFHRSDDDLQEGQAYELYRIGDDGSRIRQIWGRVLSMDEPNRMECTFMVKPLGDAETKLTWILEEAAGGTRLSLTHEGIEEAAGEQTMRLLMAFDDGWDEHFDQLRKAVADT